MSSTRAPPPAGGEEGPGGQEGQVLRRVMGGAGVCRALPSVRSSAPHWVRRAPLAPQARWNGPLVPRKPSAVPVQVGWGGHFPGCDVGSVSPIGARRELAEYADEIRDEEEDDASVLEKSRASKRLSTLMEAEVRAATPVDATRDMERTRTRMRHADGHTTYEARRRTGNCEAGAAEAGEEGRCGGGEAEDVQNTEIQQSVQRGLRIGTGPAPATSAPGLGSHWAHPCHICTGTGPKLGLRAV